MPGAGKPSCATVTHASDSRTLTMRAHERSGLLQHWAPRLHHFDRSADLAVEHGKQGRAVGQTVDLLRPLPLPEPVLIDGMVLWLNARTAAVPGAARTTPWQN
ncbi:hypothetical protein CJO94_19075 (plasmid) [Ralstonia solanacearum]|nr:hypothetical protein CJO94_19075 [Ralstonia solanacearum]